MEDKIKISNTSKTKERREPQMDIQEKKKQGFLKNTFANMASSQTFTYNPLAGKVLHEVDNIIKIGIEKEVALVEKDTTIKNSTDIIDNLRKNILHLQMEYEKLDQSYQREISYRSEIIKRMDTTRSIVETAVQYSAILSTSLKQLENDKLKIAEFYELIYQGQKEVEAKHSELEKIIKNQEDSLKDEIEILKIRQEKLLFENSEAQNDLYKKISIANDKLKVTTEENNKLLSQAHHFKENLKTLETSLEEQKNFQYKQEENIIKLKDLLKNVKSKKIKCQRNLKNKFKEVLKLKKQNKNLLKNLSKLKTSVHEFLSKNNILEIEKNELKSKLENQLECNSNSHRLWEGEKKNFLDQISAKNNEIKELNIEKSELSAKIMDISKKEIQFDQLQNHFSEIFNNNKELTENIINLNQEIDAKTKVISELKIKLNSLPNSQNFDITKLKNESQKYREMVRNMNEELCNNQKKLASEIEQKQQLINQFKNGLEEYMKYMTKKMKEIEDLIIVKTTEIKKLQSEIEDKNSCLVNLKSQVKNLSLMATKNENTEKKLSKNLEELNVKNSELYKSLENLTKHNQLLNKELEHSNSQISELEKKLNFEKMTNKTMENNILHLERKIEQEKKSFEQLEQKYLMAENNLSRLSNVLEDNSVLKSSVIDIKKSLEEAEAKVEAYKVIVKKLESENNDLKATEEMSKPKTELIRSEEARKRDEQFFKLQIETLQQKYNIQLNRKEQEIVDLKKTIETLKDTKYSSHLEKENETNNSEVSKFQDPLTPLKNNKKFLLTPRKILNSTPQLSESSQTRLHSDSHVNKKRDPYEFDSDSSVERFDADQVLKVFNSCKKKNISKKPKKNN